MSHDMTKEHEGTECRDLLPRIVDTLQRLLRVKR